MNKYDKIYIPCDENDSALFAAWGEEETDYVGAIQGKENIVCLTIQELREVFEAGIKYSESLRIENYTSPNFTKYLTSKGITL